MKRVLFIITVMLISIAASAQQITKSFIANDFSGITASNIFDIELTKSGVESVVVIADKDVMQYVEAKVVMGQLNLNLNTYSMPRSVKKDLKSIKVKINITADTGMGRQRGRSQQFDLALAQSMCFGKQSMQDLRLLRGRQPHEDDSA